MQENNNYHNGIPFPSDRDAPRERKGKSTPVASASGERDGSASPPKRRFIPKPADTFTTRDHDFLWFPYLPLGDYAVLSGDGGTGKSWFSAYIATIVSTGRLFPNEPSYVCKKRGKVLFINSEDDGDDIRSRLEKCGADLSNIEVLDKEAVFDPEAKQIITYTDPEIEMILKESAPSLVIFDPIHAFFPQEVNMNSLQSVRGITTLISNLAKKYNCAILLLSHQGKGGKGGANANYSMLGSVDIPNASRSCLQIMFDDENTKARFVIHTKSNHAAFGDTMRFIFSENNEFCFDQMRPDITRFVLEDSINRKEKISKVVTRAHRINDFDAHIEEKAKDLIQMLDESGKTSINRAYKHVSDKYGESFWCDMQPKSCLKKMEPVFHKYGYSIRYKGVKYQKTGQSEPGFELSKGYSFIDITEQILEASSEEK